MMVIELSLRQREAIREALTMYIETLRAMQRESSYSGINARRIEAALGAMTLLTKGD